MFPNNTLIVNEVILGSILSKKLHMNISQLCGKSDTTRNQQSRENHSYALVSKCDISSTGEFELCHFYMKRAICPKSVNF